MSVPGHSYACGTPYGKRAMGYFIPTDIVENEESFGYHDLQFSNYRDGVTAVYHEKQWHADMTGDPRTYRRALASMTIPISENVWRITSIIEGGTKHFSASPPEHMSWPWWEYDVPMLHTVTLTHVGASTFLVDGPTESSLSGVSMALFGHADCHLGQVIGAPNTGYQIRTPLDNAMFHDNENIYSLYATGPTKAYGMICWDTGEISTPILPTAVLEQYAWPDMMHVGDGRYILVVRKYLGPRKTLGVFLGSPWVGWEEVSPDAVKGSALSPLNVFGEYLHAEGIYYNYHTGACQLEAVIKDLSNSTYRFAKYNRTDFTDRKWRLVGQPQGVPDTGDLSFSLTSYGKGAAATRRFKAPNMFAAFNQNQNIALSALTPTWARFANSGTAGDLSPVYTVSTTR